MGYGAREGVPIALQTKTYWLDAPDGRVMLGTSAVLIGRSADCNIVLEDPEVSRLHLLVRLGVDGAEMLPLGREPVRHNGAECQALTAIRGGDVIAVGAWTFRVGEEEIGYAPRASATAWHLERHSGLRRLVTGPTFRVGGGADDDFIVEGWEPAVLALSTQAVPPLLTALRPGVWCGRALAVGEALPLAADARVTYREESFHLRATPTHAGMATHMSTRPKHAVMVLLEFLPRGGRLTFELGGRLRSTLLSDRRCDLAACLLQPPTPLRAGDFVPEETLCERVWPGGKNGRTELNSLLYRLRQYLTDEGINPAPLFERQGGGLRFCLAPGARVVVR